jgi:hypothetical protein
LSSVVRCRSEEEGVEEGACGCVCVCVCFGGREGLV